jgi:hypothetical protein
MTYVFLGSISEVIEAGIKLTRSGQRVDLSSEMAEATKHPRGLPCIPAEQFDALGITEAELKRYPVPEARENAPAEFKAKWAQALEILHANRGGE